MNKNLRSLLLLILASWVSTSTALAQTAPPANLSGTQLRTWLRQNWYDGKRIDLGYDRARGHMYHYVDNYNNQVEGVYSGYLQSFPYSETSTTTNIPNINCEHTVPQSWFNEASRMKSDIHHLFPTVIQWNSDRGSDPFADIPDAQTQKWIINMTSQTSIPTSNIEAYSEDTNSQFEPRESHKGNVARAIFYFYTMHEGQAFDPGKGVPSAAGNLQTLYQWHLQDPVDARELERNNRVQRVQGNRNPFIDYPELVASAWGFEPANCSPTTQASQLAISEPSQTSFKLSWTNGSGNRRLVVVREGAAASFSPSGSYTAEVNANFAQAADQGNGHKLVYNGSGNSVTVMGLTANRTYYVQVFEFCSTDNTYNTSNAPATQVTLPDYTCTGTPSQPTASLASSDVSTGGFTLNFTAGNGDGRVVVVKEGSAPTASPQAGTAYTNANLNFSTAPALSDGSKVVYSGNGTSASIIGLKSNTQYYVTVFESCSNGWLFAAGSTPLLVSTLEAGGNLPTGAVATQDFENGADDGWAVTSGFSSSSENTGTPNGQRIKSGTKSFQVTATTTELVFESLTTTDFQNMAVEFFNSSISQNSTGNGMDSGDFIEAYVALNGAAFSTTPDVTITASGTNNVRYGMQGEVVVETTAGTPVTKSIDLLGDVANVNAPSRVIIRIPEGTSAVQLKLIIKNNAANEVLNIDDVTLYGSTATGIPEALEEELLLYPNPSSGSFAIKVPAQLNVQEVSVFSSMGQLVVRQKAGSNRSEPAFHLPHLPKGIYLVQVKTNQGVAVRRLVVQ